MDPSIIIVTHNGMPWIQRCLDSCNSYPIIVVDNASSDETVSFIRANFPDITVLSNEKNLGFGQANNIGIKYALKKNASHILLLNQDAYLQKDCINKLMEFQIANPEFGIISPIHINGTKDKLDKKFSMFMTYENGPDFYSDYVLKQKLKPVYPIPFVNAAAWLLSKNLIDTVGGFDPIFFHYGEDDNYCQRASYHNFKIGVIPDSFIIHDRENRKMPVVVPYSDRYYELRERSIKIKFANINNPRGLDQLQDEITRLKKTLLKLKLKGKFNKLAAMRKELKLFKKTVPLIRKSREANMIKGKTHL